MSEQKPDLNVYGHNLPNDRIIVQPGIREQQAAVSQPGGNRADRRKKPRQHALDEHPELEETPMPPRHAPLSDEVPS